MLEVRNLTRKFGELTAVNDVSFTVPAGSLTGFVGGNGAGKTTTMRMILGILDPSAGEVLWDGRPITRQVRSQIGYMPEERGLYDKQPVLRQLIYLGQLHGMTAAQAKAAAEELLRRFGLGERLNAKLETLSLGNQQRVQITAAVLAQPIALVLDEPFSGLDPDAVDQMVAVLHEFTARGVPVLFSSHQLDLVERLCNHIVILAKGSLVASGSVEELRSQGETHHRINTDADLGWLRQVPGVTVLDLVGGQADVRFDTDDVAQRVLHEALSRGPVRSFGPIQRSISEIYREVTR